MECRAADPAHHREVEALGGELDIDPLGAGTKIPRHDPDCKLAIGCRCLQAEGVQAAGVLGRDRSLPLRKRSATRFEEVQERARIIGRNRVEVVACHLLQCERVQFRGAVARKCLEIGEIPAEIEVESMNWRSSDGCQGDECRCRHEKLVIFYHCVPVY